MIDLTEDFSLLARRSWVRRAAEAWARAEAEALTLTVDFDDDAGEDWARLMQDGGVIGFVSMVRPLVFIQALHGEAIHNESPDGPVVIFVPRVDDAIFRCDPESIVTMFGGRLSSTALNFDCFSAEDLWYSTV
ncbi:hypothetical protein [Amycolatopsis sp. GM8]|uniref:hypothetical protein n=1 Tax=Amycolatopsis sp. GM8 TaxID=2896530 RepID=UPI001F2AA092|nr:hypothetical protein [Amycolatopsis sp. GM8]